MSDPRLTAYEGFPDGVSDSFCRHAATATSQYGTTARALAAEVLAYRADVERLTAERDALQQRILGMEDRLDIVTAEDAMKKIAHGGTLHNADGSQRCWCATLQVVGSAFAKCPPCLARDMARLTAENVALKEIGNALFVRAGKLEAEHAALREERDALKDGIKAELNGGNSLPDFWTPERQLPYVAKALTAARAERDALREELATQECEICAGCDSIRASRRRSAASTTRTRSMARRKPRTTQPDWSANSPRPAPRWRDYSRRWRGSRLRRHRRTGRQFWHGAA